MYSLNNTISRGVIVAAVVADIVPMVMTLKKMPFKILYMKTKKILLIAIVMTLVSSCGSIRVFADYDPEVNFNSYQSFAFFKPGIDEMKISELGAVLI